MSQSDARSIAIVGIGCRFPGGVNTLDQFWSLLREGRQAIGDIPADRVDLQRFHDATLQTPGKMSTRFGGYLSDIDLFDADFFSVAPRDAERIDPQQRLLLETAWEALEDAGADLAHLEGGRVGVFVGQWLSDFEQRLFAHPDELDFSMTLGSGRYAASGRISYAFNFTGPSITLDTACSSSLSAVHLAVRSLRSGETNLALAGGVNVILGPHIYVAYSQSGMMAPDGLCKFGDARADGYVRSEGAGMLALKRLDDAVRDGDRIHAVIRGSAVNNDGRTSGSMGTPSLAGQKDLLTCALADAGVAPMDVGYVEAHGTGTRAGDKVEIGALAAVLGQGRDPSAPLVIGSVKTNLGHTESAAGVAGLIKAVLAVREGEIPGSRNLKTPNPDVPWDAAPVSIPQVATPWITDAAPRRAGVSGFGISGANAHVIVESPPAPAPFARDDRPTPILTLSARSAAALRSLAGEVAEDLASGATALDDLLRFAQTRRTAHSHRAAFLATDAGELVAAVQAYAAGGPALAEGVADPRKPSKVALVFPGQGGQWSGMARGLLAAEPVFRAALERADAVIQAQAGWSLLEQLALDPGQPGYLGDRIDVIQPTLGAMSIAYAEWMKAQGLAVRSVVGHSMGEAAAAHAAGALSLEDALRVLCRRSTLMRAKSGEGVMALVDLPQAEVTQTLKGLEAKVSVAAVNSPRATVISGDKEVVEGLVARFVERGVFSRPINVDVASHSPQMEGPSRALREELADLAPSVAATTFVSSLLGRPAAGEALDADYWARNLREPVQFAQALDVLVDQGVTAFLELGPHPVLAPSIDQALQRGGSPVAVVGCGRRDEAESSVLLDALARLWCAGAAVDWSRGAAPARVVDFPLYPWNRRRLWVETADISRTNTGGNPLKALDDEARSWLHHTTWREPSRGGTTIEAPGRWLLIGDGEDLRQALSNVGVETDAAPLDSLEARLSALSQDEVNVVVVAPKGDEAAFLPVRVVQALPRATGVRLWFVTRGAQHPEGPARVDIDQAALWGAARVLADERPELWGGVLDLPADCLDRDGAARATAWLLDPQGEDQAALRDNRILVPRITRLETDNARAVWRADGAYLLTGGLGEVGLAVARAMVEEGARRLILMGRNGLPPRRAWSGLDPMSKDGRRVAAVREMEALGATIHSAVVDVADEADLRRFLDDYEAEGWPPIRGVVHLAAILDSRLIGDTSRAQFDAVMAGKLRGARNLDRLLPELDCFVLFSSTTTFIPQPGTAAYVAANSGLEALAADRRARGAPAVAIAWGQWRAGLLSGEAGAAVIAEQAQLGVGAFTPERGAGLFSWAAARRDPGVAIAPIDWSIYAKARSGRPEPLLREMKGASQAGDVSERLAKAQGAEVIEIMSSIVTEAVACTLQFAPDEVEPTREFGAMGLTSLLAMELRNRLEQALARPLSATLAWNYPTVLALSAYLADDGKARSPVIPSPQRPVSGDLAAKVAAVAQLSDADALSALRRGRRGASS